MISKALLVLKGITISGSVKFSYNHVQILIDLHESSVHSQYIIHNGQRNYIAVVNSRTSSNMKLCTLKISHFYAFPS